MSTRPWHVLGGVDLTSAQLHPVDGVDDLGEAVLAGLARPIGYKQSPTVLRTLVGGLLTFGVLPVLSWQKKFRQYATLEQQQLWHLADWVRRSGRAEQGEELIRAAEAVRPPPLLKGMIFAYITVCGWLFYRTLSPFRFHSLLFCTYRFPLRHVGVASANARHLYGLWVLSLSAVYLLHWLQVQWHARSIRRFLRAFNEVAGKGRFELVRAMPVGIGVRPLWVIAGILCLALNAPWGLLMMLAGSAQRRLIRHSSTIQRAQLAMRLRMMMLTARPGVEVPVPIHLRPMCRNELCRNQLGPTAQFCPRCGVRVTEPLQRIG